MEQLTVTQNQTLSDEENFNLYAMQHYDNPQCHSIQEFEEDLKKFLYLKKLITRYRVNGDLRERLILNHIIVLYNVFGAAATRMLFYKIDESCWDTLITFLVYLDRMPEAIPEFNIVLSDIVLDESIISTLRKI
jgi:hypothetical protein